MIVKVSGTPYHLRFDVSAYEKQTLNFEHVTSNHLSPSSVPYRSFPIPKSTAASPYQTVYSASCNNP